MNMVKAHEIELNWDIGMTVARYKGDSYTLSRLGRSPHAPKVSLPNIVKATRMVFDSSRYAMRDILHISKAGKTVVLKLLECGEDLTLDDLIKTDQLALTEKRAAYKYRPMLELLVEICDEIWNQDKEDFKDHANDYVDTTRLFLYQLKKHGKKQLAWLEGALEHGFYLTEHNLLDSFLRENYFVSVFQLKNTRTRICIFTHTEAYEKAI